MKVKNVVEGVPLAELVGTIEMDDRRLMPPDHVVNVVRIAWVNPSVEVSDDVASFVRSWVSGQRDIQVLASDILVRLEEVAPPPSHKDLIEGTAVFPSWMGEWWASVLRFPWAGQLAEATAAAMEWLDGHQS